MPLFGRKRHNRSPPAEAAPHTADASPRTFDEIVNPFYASRDWEGLLGALERLDPDQLEEGEARQWYMSRGTAAEQLGRRDEAVGAYTEGLRRNPDSSTLHVIVGRLLQEEGRFDEALPHLKSVRLDDGGGVAVMAAAQYCYLWDAFEDAAAIQSQIFSAYFGIGIIDDHFLYSHRLPFFSQAFGAQAAILKLDGRPDEAKALLEKAVNRFPDLSGAEEERLTLEATLGQPSGLIEHLSRTAQRGKGNGLSGYDGMRLAAWRARESDQLTQAEQQLASVKVREEDFPWLEDIRLLAAIAAARRAGDLREDDQRVTEFFEHKPLLFEPEHAFYFGLLDEQEVLKEAYRARRRELGPPAWGNRARA